MSAEPMDDEPLSEELIAEYRRLAESGGHAWPSMTLTMLREIERLREPVTPSMTPEEQGRILASLNDMIRREVDYREARRKEQEPLNRECIGIMREHLQRAGISAAFADDCAAIAANQILTLRKENTELERRVGELKEHLAEAIRELFEAREAHGVLERDNEKLKDALRPWFYGVRQP